MKNISNNRKLLNTGVSMRAKWFILMVFVLLFALVATTAAQEKGTAADPNPPVQEPVLESRTVTPTGTDEQWTFFAFKDSFLSSANPNTNYGTWSTVYVGYRAADFQAVRMLFEFNLSTIPSNSVINSATLSIYQSASVPSNDVDMGLLAQYMKSSWGETTVTWNNANYLGGDQIGVGNGTNALGWKNFDVSNVVREWVSGARANYGFIVTGYEDPQVNRSRTFYSRQRAGFEPRLTVNFNQSCDNVPPTAWVETLPQWSKSSFTVKWTGTDSAPSGCTPVGIAYYDVQYSINGGSWTNWQGNNTGTSATFTGAQNGQTYQFRARAADKAGNLQAWTVSQTQTKIDTIHPEASVVPLNNYTLGPNFTVSWDGQDNSGGSGIASYDVQFTEGGSDWKDWLVGTTSKSATFTGGQNGVLYEFRARATDAAGNIQPWSDLAQTSTTVVNNPVAIVQQFDPIILEPSAPVTDSFQVNWKGYTVAGVNIDNYELQWKFNNGPWIFWQEFPGAQTSASFNLLQGEDGTYYFEARALTNAVNVEDEQFHNTSEAFKIVDFEPPFFSIQSYIPILPKNTE